jgi:CRP/FNR family transcriptional regulator, cyclic AMP receptor protein
MDRHAWIDERLAEVPLFQGLSKKELGRVSSLAMQIERPAGTVLTTEGDVGHEFMIVLEGLIEVWHNDRVLATRGPGTYFGEIALVDRRPRTATVVARTPVVLEVIGHREFTGLLAEVPELAKRIDVAKAERLEELEADSG